MKPLAEIEIIGSRGRHKCEALVDTGFDGFVTLSRNVAVQLGLELVAIQRMAIADGREIDAYVVEGKVAFLGRTSTVFIHLSDSDEALIGTYLLGDCELTIDFHLRNIRIVRKDI